MPSRRNLRPASEPTEHRPYAPEKLQVLIERVRNGEELWHPDDATLEGDE
jgi:hypothetical protein